MSTFHRTELLDGILTITLDQQDSAVNTVSPAWIDAMTKAFEEAAENDAVSGIVVTSAKRGFMAGADLKFLVDNPMGVEDAFDFSQRATRFHRLVETCGKPVVAAINGFSLGGGYELALACTHRIVADEPGAVVGLPEVNFGLLPGSGGTQRLPRLIGLKRAADALLSGRSYAPQSALDLGLVDTVVTPDKLIKAARDWLAAGPEAVRPWDRKGFNLPESDGLLRQTTAGYFTLMTAKLRARYGGNYPAPISILACLFEGIQVPIEKALLVESRHFARLVANPVGRNIIRTTFVDKAAAEKGARRPEGIAPFKVARLAVLGAGMMGAGIAFAAARAGIAVVLLDTTKSAAEKGKDYAARILDKQVERGLMPRDNADTILGLIQPTIDYEDLAGSDLVIEAVFEDTAIKAEVTRKAAAVIGPYAVFATNTSTLPISSLAVAFDRPPDFIGLHFFSPVEKMGLVEVIMGALTTPATLARALDFIAQLRKTPIVVNDSRGFYTSRVFQTFIHEGMELLREGTTPALIENVARQAGMPVGPLAVLDEVTLELPMQIVHQSEAEDPCYKRPTSMSVLETMVDDFGRSGRKGGGGFYDYPEGNPKHLWKGLAEAFPTAETQTEPAEIRKRLLYIQAIESARCLEEGVLTHPADADLGSVFGWGFPSWTGGTISLIETVGLPQFVAECDNLTQRYGGRFAPPESLRRMAAESKVFDRS